MSSRLFGGFFFWGLPFTQRDEQTTHSFTRFILFYIFIFPKTATIKQG